MHPAVRLFPAFLVVVLVALLPSALRAHGLAAQPASAAAAEGTLVATVRANATIDLRQQDGTAVTQLAPGTYSVEVHDETASHNFHLSGPGVNQSTAVSFVGTATWSVTFSAGTYTFVCDPHNDFMNGSFTVGTDPAPPPPPPAPATPVLTGWVGPDYVIGLRDAQGNDLNDRQIPAGTYRIEIRDYSPIHNFELKGDNFDQETDEEWTGQVTWTATFRPGDEYEYECDPHHDLLWGRYTVGAASPPPPPPPPPCLL
jgi:plastocyanin